MTAEEIALAVIRLPPNRQIRVYDMVCRLHDMHDPPDAEILVLAMRMALAMHEQAEREAVELCSK